MGVPEVKRDYSKIQAYWKDFTIFTFLRENNPTTPWIPENTTVVTSNLWNM